MREKIHTLKSNQLFTNSFYLLLASGAVAGFGFVFWTVVARVFADSDVGLAATLLSLSSLISLLSLAGFDTTFVRFLSKSERREDYTNSGLIIASLLSVVLSVIFLIGFPLYAPDLVFVLANPLFIAAFILFNVFTTLNTLTNSIFLAHRKAQYTFLVNILFSLVKALLPFVAIGGGAMAIFTVSGVAQIVGVGLSFWVMAYKFDHHFSLRIHSDILRLSKKYSLSVYVSSIFNLLPPTILPLILTAQLGPESSAYYYMAFTIATLLFTIAYSAMQSVFAESSHAEAHLFEYLKKALKVLVVTMVPMAIALGIIAPYLLQVFGVRYAQEGSVLLQLLALSSIAVALYSAAGTVFKVRHAVGALLWMNVVYAAVVIGFSVLLIPSMGLEAVGWSWLAGNVFAVVVGMSVFYFFRRRTAS